MRHEHKKIQRALKTLMKKRRMTYQDIGRALRVSPATVKRRLNGDDMTIEQLREFAGALSVSFYELIELSKKEGNEPHHFTAEQESLLSRQVSYVQVLRLALMGKTFREIQLALSAVKEAELRKILRELEKVALVRLLAGDRVVPMARFPFKWQPDGALERTYAKRIRETIAKRMVNEAGEAGLNRHFEMILSPETYQDFCQDLENTFLKYRSLSEVHLESKTDKRRLVSGVLFADIFSVWGDQQITEEKT